MSEHSRLHDYLCHIVQAIERIERYTAAMDEPAFCASEITQDAVVRNIEIVGEASHSILIHHAEFACSHPKFELAYAYQMRNAVSHGYAVVDLGIVWRVVQDSLPGFKAHALRALSSAPKPET